MRRRYSRRAGQSDRYITKQRRDNSCGLELLLIMKNANADCNEAGALCCASCGIAEKNDNDDIKLKNCTACYLVRYCSIECQKEHRPKHKQACKERAAELRNELLFKQPESTHLGDCPICMMPLPLDPEKSIMMSCCSKVICNGCAYANHKREVEASLVPSCLFCRKHRLESSEEIMKQLMKRVEANDPVAMRRVAFEQYSKEEYRSAFECWTKANWVMPLRTSNWQQLFVGKVL